MPFREKGRPMMSLAPFLDDLLTRLQNAEFGHPLLDSAITRLLCRISTTNCESLDVFLQTRVKHFLLAKILHGSTTYTTLIT